MADRRLPSHPQNVSSHLPIQLLDDMEGYRMCTTAATLHRHAVNLGASSRSAVVVKPRVQGVRWPREGATGVKAIFLTLNNPRWGAHFWPKRILKMQDFDHNFSKKFSGMLRGFCGKGHCIPYSSPFTPYFVIPDIYNAQPRHCLMARPTPNHAVVPTRPPQDS